MDKYGGEWPGVTTCYRHFRIFFLRFPAICLAAEALFGKLPEKRGLMTTAATETASLQLQDFGLKVGERTLLSGVNLRFRAPGLTVVFGRSGTGKTTLLKAMGLLHPSHGGVRLTGGDLEPLKPEAFRCQVQYVHQEPRLFSGTVGDNLRLPLALKQHRHLAVTDAQLADHLERLGLTGSLLEQTADKLSGGEKQRVALVRSLILQPRFLLLDEPTSAMDLASEEKALLYLQELSAQLGIVAVSHSVAVIEAAQRVLLLANGTLTEITENLDRVGIKRMVEDG